MIYRIALVLSAVVALTGCGAPTIDATSAESGKESLDTVRESLSPEDRERFDEALPLVAFKSVESLADLATLAENIESGAALDDLDGMTGQQVIEEGERILAERRAKERDQALLEIAELEEAKANADVARAELAKFEVTKSRFRQVPQRFGNPKPIIELSVTNGTEHPISRAYFHGTLATPGRSIPWVSEDFNYPIRGGLEPGESANWSLAPNQFSEWGQVEARADMVLTVEVVKLDGPDEETLYDARFTDEQQERLDSLKAEYQ